MEKEIDESNKANVEQEQTKEESVIPAIVADSQESDDEWSHLMPCAQKMMQGVTDEASVIAYTLAKHFHADNVPQDYTLKDLLIWNRKNKPPLDEVEINEAISAAYKGRGGKSFNSRGCANETVQTFCDTNCPLSPHRAKGDASKYFQGKYFSPKILSDELVSAHHFV